MLKGVPKNASPMLLKILCEMGHGDEIVIADGNFPSETNGKRVVRADGLGGIDILNTVLSLIPLDTYADQNFLLMNTKPEEETPSIWAEYFSVANRLDDNVRVAKLERQEFYDRAKNAYAVIATGEEAIYANIIIKKGVIK